MLGTGLIINSPTKLSVQQTKRLTLPVLQRHKWRCRSAPELSRPAEQHRNEIIRSLSYQDMPFSSSLLPDGRQTLLVHHTEVDDVTPSLLWGEEAYRHYKLLTMIEKQERLRCIKSVKRAVIKKCMWKQKVLQNIVNTAKAYYSNPTDENREKWRKLRAEIHQSQNHSITDIQYSLAHIPQYTPYFTVALCLAHVLFLIVMCSVSNFAPAGLLSEKEVAREVQTFLGAETVHRYVIPNPWIGPPVTTFLTFGASFGLCMRRDGILDEHARKRKYRPLDDKAFGCCEMRGPLNAAGTTTQEECNNYTNKAGLWSPPYCSRRPPGQKSVAHVIRPCCADHMGTCLMLSKQHCTFLGGIFHPNQEHCVQVLCVQDVCTIGRNLSKVKPDHNKPWLPTKNTTWQYWRLLVALVYTYGILHCLTLMAIEWLLMRPLEKHAGWFRVMLVYSLSGVAGQIVACTAQPYIPHVGSTSGVAGIIGEAAVELSWAWTLLDNPRPEVIKLASFFAVLMILGLFPYISLLGSITGGACGAMSAFIFMAYLIYDQRGRVQKALLTTAAVVGLTVFFSVLTYVFLKLQPAPCQGCRSLECISLSDNMCNQWDLLG